MFPFGSTMDAKFWKGAHNSRTARLRTKPHLYNTSIDHPAKLALGITF